MTGGRSLLESELAHGILAQQADALIEGLSALRTHCSDRWVHDTRVLSRRLRTSLEAFRDLLNPKSYKLVYRAARKITRILGKPRETSVALGILYDLTNAGDLAEVNCRKRLVDRLERKLRKQKRRLERDLATIDPHYLQFQVQCLLSGRDPNANQHTPPSGKMKDRPESKLKASAKRPGHSALFSHHETDCERAQRIWAELAQPLLAFRPRWHFHRATDEKLHQLRISAKQLRYSMELFASIWPDDLQKEIADARALQNAGGAYHDWCVLCENLKKEIQRTYQKGSTQRAFQIGRLLAIVEDRKSELRKPILFAIKNLQSTLGFLLPVSDPVPERMHSLKMARNKKKRPSAELKKGIHRRLETR
jgi:CHAD domain-containing protein